MFSKFDKFYQQTDPRNSKTPKQGEHKENNTKHIMIKLLKASIKENILKESQGEKTHIHRETTRMSINILSETKQAMGQRKEKKTINRNLHPVKISLGEKRKN